MTVAVHLLHTDPEMSLHISYLIVSDCSLLWGALRQQLLLLVVLSLSPAPLWNAEVESGL